MLNINLTSIITPSISILFDNWFLPDSGSTFNCGGFTGTTYSIPVCDAWYSDYEIDTTGLSTDWRIAVATDSLETVDWNDETKAKFRLYLYTILKNDSVVAQSRAEFIEFMALYEESVINAQWEVSEELRAVEQYDSLFTALINNADSLIRFYSDSINYIFEHELQEEYSVELEQMYYLINFLEQTKSNLISVRQAFVEGELGEIQNDYVVTPELPYQNNQYIDDIYINILEEDNFEAVINNYSNVFAIANQCPAAGGQAVHRARAMLALINDSLEYDDLNACLQVGIYRETEIFHVDESFDFNLIPNPASKEVIVEFITKQTGKCKLRIYNAIGSSVSQYELDCELTKHIINLDQFLAGVYMVEVKFNNFKQVKKLIIIK
jgi:hypothetical protein